MLSASLLTASLATVAPAQVVDLSQLGSAYAGFRIFGDDFDDNSGFSVSGAGDVNGDGLSDLIIGAPTADPGAETSAGECYIVFGKTDSGSVDLENPGSSGFRITGVNEQDRFGHSVSGAGDVNGDGFADLIIGARNASPEGKNRAGESFVIFGKSGLAAVDLTNLGDGGFRISGIDDGDRSGSSLSGAGDVNGDGLADLIIGAPEADAGPREDAGESYVVFGKTDSAPVSLADLEADSRGFRIDGMAPYDYSGYSVSGAGDVNGDGLADLIVGTYFRSKCYVILGKADTATVGLGSLGSGGFQIDGSGENVSGAGDVNGDGFADLIACDDGSGECFVVFGKTDTALLDLEDLEADSAGFRIVGSLIGSSVSAAGDLNGDGLADLVVGAKNAAAGGDAGAGQCYVVFGKTDTATIDLASLGAMGFRLDGINAFDGAGRSVSGAGDVNGDGLADLVIGAYNADSGGEANTGETYVVFGPGPGITPGVAPEAPGSVTTPSSAVAAGDPGPIVVGYGDGTQSSPARTIVDFAGAGGTIGRVTAELNKATPIPAPFTAGDNAAPIIWEVETTRTGWTTADVTFQYTDAEITGLDEANLLLYKADNVDHGGNDLPIYRR